MVIFKEKKNEEKRNWEKIEEKKKKLEIIERLD